MPTKLDSNKSEVNGLLDHLRDIEYSLKSPHNLERGRELLGAYQRITNRLRTIAPDKVPTRSGQLGPSSLAPVTQEPIQSAYGPSSTISTPVEPNAALAAFQALPSSAPAPLPVPLQRSSNAATKNVGQTTPKAGQAAQAAQPGGAPFPAMPAERVSDTGAPLNPTPAQIESSPELAAFKAALEAPAPVFKGIGFTKAEQLALGFLAGLKGVESVAPIIAQRRAEAWQVYEAAKGAREDRLRGLQTIAQFSESDKARREALSERTAADAESKRRFELGFEQEERKILSAGADRDENRALREAMARRPTEGAIVRYNDSNAALDSISRIKELADRGVGGPVEGPAASIGKYLPFIRFTGRVSDNQDLAAELANLNTIFAPNRLGANIPPGERELISGVLRNPSSTESDVLKAMNVLERFYKPLRDEMLNRYDFGITPQNQTGADGLDVKRLLEKGYRLSYTSTRGNPVYQLGNSYKEVIPNAN